jgi:hypothetical protein
MYATAKRRVECRLEFPVSSEEVVIAVDCRAFTQTTAERSQFALSCLVLLLFIITSYCASAQSGAQQLPVHGSPDGSVWLAAGAEHALTLYAMALAESRRPWTDGLVRPWPWSLHTPTEHDMYFPNYEAALVKLRELLARGETNVDVGILQINWRANAYRLPDPAELLIPRNNIGVAAQMLRELLEGCNGDWSCAVARYHSPRKDLGEAYEAAVRQIIERLRGVQGVLDALAQ